MSKLDIQKVPNVEDRKLPIFDELEEMADRIRVRAFNLFAGRGFTEGHDLEDWLTAEREVGWPAAELIEEDDEFEVKVALAGFEPEDITITANPRELIIKASRTDERADTGEKEGSTVRWSEFESNDVYRHIELPAEIDIDRVTAELERGMLEIEAPKVRKSKPESREIRITTDSD